MVRKIVENRMQTPLWMTCLTLLILSLPGFANGQPQNPPQEETIRVGINLVTVNVIVTDSKGRYVKGLKPELFSIYDEKVKQTIVHFEGGGAPVSIGIVCEILLVISDGQDQSSRHPYSDLRNRLREFDAQVYTISIADPSIDEFAGYHRWIFEDFTRQTGRRSFLLNSEAAMGRAVLAELARVSGGSAYSPETESEPELAAICTQIAVEMREQYTLAFYPSQLNTRKWHRLKVRVEPTEDRSGLKLFYREGYQIPGNKRL